MNKSEYSKIHYHNFLRIYLIDFGPHFAFLLDSLPKIKINISQNLNKKRFYY